jgi:hypothetical protein
MLIGLRTTEEHFFAQSRALRRGSEVADLPSIKQPKLRIVAAGAELRNAEACRAITAAPFRAESR